MRFALLLLLLIATPTKAVERILDFHSEILIAADGVMTVTEVIDAVEDALRRVLTAEPAPAA